MSIIRKYISDVKNVSWFSYDENSDSIYYQENNVDISNNKRHSKLFKLELNTNISSKVTNGDNDSIPKISPDGKKLAYIRKNKISDKLTLNSLYIKDLTNNDESQITSDNQTISTAYDSNGSFNWNHESNQIAYTYRNIVERDDDSEPYEVNRIRYRQDVIGWLGDVLNNIEIYSLSDKQTISIPDTGGDDTHPVFSRNNKYIAFISDEGDTRDTHWREDIHLYEIESSKRSRISSYFNGIGSITWGKDDESLYVIGTSENKEGDGRNSSLYKINIKNNDISNLNSEEFAFNPQPNLKIINNNLRVTYTDKGVSKIVDIDEDNKTIVYENNSKILQILDSNNKTIFIENNRDTHEVIKIINKEDGSTTDVLTPNLSFYSENKPAIMDKFSINRSNFEIESRVYLPSDFTYEKKYPLIVDIHGGPHGRFEDQIAINQEIFTKSGYIVLAVNPRGSSSYGAAFGQAVLNDWGGEDYLDIMESIDKISNENYVDQDNIGLYGYSYGGFMSSWIIGHTNKFKAAVIGAPCINLNSMAGTSDIGIKFGEEQWGGLRYDNEDKYKFNSPLTYAKNVSTPSIILVGDRDYRCPIEQAEQYFVTLKRMGNDVQLIRYPGGNHGMLSGSAPNLVIDYWTRSVNFFDKHLK